MRQCPVCTNKIEVNFGMAQCPQCQTVLFVDFSGNVIIGGSDEAPPEAPPLPEVPLPTDIELGHAQYIEFEPPPLDPPHFYPDLPAPAEWEQAGLEYVANAINESPEESIMVENEEIVPPTMFEEVAGESLSAPPPPIEESHSGLGLPRMANSVSATNGSIWYQIQVNGIDTSQLRQDILRILREPRLGLVNDELSENIKDGQLFIQGVNTAKASFIINSLKALPVEVQWQMYAKDPSSDHN